MRQIRETLRLHLQAGLSYNEVGRALKISKSVVGKYVSLARVAGVDWEVVQTLGHSLTSLLVAGKVDFPSSPDGPCMPSTHDAGSDTTGRRRSS
jgi:biotin operon repressor